MPRALILAEGQTEEEFVATVLAPHLTTRSVFVSATRICTRRVEKRRAFRGGHGWRYRLIRKDVVRLLADSGAAAVTTMIDLHHLPEDFPRPAGGLSPRPAERADQLEAAFAGDIGGGPRFIPNLVVHEFEALLFADVARIQAAFPDCDRSVALADIARAFATPEDIDDGNETAPSRRLAGLFPSYEKPLHGPRIAAAIGLAAIRGKCRRFDRWLSRIESLAATA